MGREGAKMKRIPIRCCQPVPTAYDAFGGVTVSPTEAEGGG